MCWNCQFRTTGTELLKSLDHLYISVFDVSYRPSPVWSSFVRTLFCSVYPEFLVRETPFAGVLPSQGAYFEEIRSALKQTVTPVFYILTNTPHSFNSHSEIYILEVENLSLMNRMHPWCCLSRRTPTLSFPFQFSIYPHRPQDLDCSSLTRSIHAFILFICIGAWIYIEP